ncbi:helix-turn-helix domain-containing protein [Streptomyces griseoincarnatus]|uniref:helix-turn-helix domain-containing protein n=1 Tax=unclassified Streptomyces TaxID=2593676 RepID=UPI0024582229|nr:helix-turn-helix transcriptional regulator [Streptomyces sp. BJ20]
MSGRDAGDAARAPAGNAGSRVREHHNLTQLEVCGRSGVDAVSYSRIEKGHSSPLLDTLIRIADAIDVPLADLVR